MSTRNLRALEQLIEGATTATSALRTERQTSKILRRALERIAAIATKACMRAGAAKVTRGRRPKLAEGSLHHRIYKAAEKPQTLAALVEGSNARPGDARRAVVLLERQGWLVRVGAGRSTRYEAAA